VEPEADRRACTEQDLTAVAAVDDVGLPSKVSLSMR